jgi:hypothetical protein
MAHINTFVDQQLIGPYAVGEIPAPLQITFKDICDVVMDLTGFTAEFEIIRLDGTTPSNMGLGTPSIPDASNGITQYVWDYRDFLTEGHYRGVMWVGDGSQRYASEWFEWFVRDSLTTVPSI